MEIKKKENAAAAPTRKKRNLGGVK